MREWRKTILNAWMPWAAVALATLLVAVGVVLALLSERDYRRQQLDETRVQAEIIAASIAPALMFDDPATAQEYLQALAANPALESAAVYDTAGHRLVWFARRAEPSVSLASDAARSRPGALEFVTPVVREGEFLGHVLVRRIAEPALLRLSRYAGIAILIIFAALVMGILGIAQGALRRANLELRTRAADLEREIAQREKAEEALIQSRKLEAIGQLTGGVAHDFNNLLQVVLSGLTMLERQPEPNRFQRILQGMRQAAERGASLTRQLLSFSRRQPLQLQPVDISHRIESMRELLERSLRADILIELRMPPDLWHGRTDPAQFELAILNTAVNARDAMPAGGLLTISARNIEGEGGEQVEITIRDTGAGIPPDVLHRVFEPYFTTKPAGQGTGLGLSQVYGLATQSGGAVRIDSVVGEGTAVIISLPRSAEAEALDRAGRPAGSDGAPLANKSVLVVEDDDAVAASVLEMLRLFGCRTERTADASSGLRALEEHGPFDVVFSDILMPGSLNGVDLAREIRRHSPAQPIVLTTGFSGVAQLNEGEFPVLRKPYDLDDLRAVLAQALRQTPAHR